MLVARLQGCILGSLWQLLVELYYLALGDSSSWHPKNFSERIIEAFDSQLVELGFILNRNATFDSEGISPGVEYRSDQFQLQFYWDRQELYAELSPLDLNLVPADATLQEIEYDNANSNPPFSFWSLLEFLELDRDINPYRLSTPGRFRKLLKRAGAVLPKLRVFIEGDLLIYIPFRRHQEIGQLRYSWDNKHVYQQAEEFKKETLQRCRDYSALWWDDKDYVSVSGVLSIIKEELTGDESKRLKFARKAAKKSKKEFRKMVAAI